METSFIGEPEPPDSFGAPIDNKPCIQCGLVDLPDYHGNVQNSYPPHCCSDECRRALKVRRELAPHLSPISGSSGTMDPSAAKKLKAFVAKIRASNDFRTPKD